MHDEIMRLGESVIQYGPLSNRIYLMKLAPGDLPGILEVLDRMAVALQYTKVFAKVPASFEAQFTQCMYRREALIPRFYRGKEDAVFLAKYYDEARVWERRAEQIATVLAAAQAKAGARASAEEPKEMAIEPVTLADIGEMAVIYRTVFDTYPFPIHEREYLRETMEGHVRYFGCRLGGKLVALSSAEMDSEGLNVEMTDFATLPDYRGHGLAAHLLARMEAEMADAGMITAYTIARAYSFGMNITFARAGYEFAGTLTNNTNISGGIESMNVWWKRLG
jgi:putative beta-lysine N-acetyltransferase